ncbi:MAG TPA: SpoIIE family protein phosphatase [Actinocrinis sp.]|nr:SpoIIE family protein phosphatase [Actinocrinis sp.]
MGAEGEWADRPPVFPDAVGDADAAAGVVTGTELPSAVDALVRVVEEQREAEARLRVDFLAHGLVDQAIGVLVGQLDCGPDEAFGQLLEIERRSGQGLLEIAGELVGHGVDVPELLKSVQGRPSGAPQGTGGASAREAGDEAGTGEDGNAEASAPGSTAAAKSTARSASTSAPASPPRLDRVAEGDELARLLLGDTLAWTGAAEVAIALHGPDDVLELIGSAGLPHRVVSQWRRIPPQMDCLLNTAVREQVPVWSDSFPADHAPRSPRERSTGNSPGSPAVGQTSAAWSSTGGAQPDGGQPGDMHSSHGQIRSDSTRPDQRRRSGPLLIGEPAANAAAADRVHVAVPMRFGRSLIGAIEVGWPAGSTFPAEQRRDVTALLEATGQAVVRSRRPLGAAESQSGREAAREAGRDLDRLREVIDAVWEPLLLVRAVPDGHGPAGGFRVAAANPAAVEQFGSPGPDRGFTPVGRLLLELIPWAAASGAFEGFRTALAARTPYLDPEHMYIEGAAKDAEAERHIRHLSVGAAAVGDGLLLVSLRPAQDGPGQWRARAARLRRLSGTGAWEWDVAAGRVHWSAEALTVLGSRAVPGPAPQERPPYLVHRDDEAEHARLLRTLVRDGRPAQAEFRIIRPDSAVRYMRMAGEPVSGQDDVVTAVFGTVQDVTERRRAETGLELAQIQLAAQRSRADSERQLADLLLQVIMPVEPARIPPAAALEVAARYRPASAGAGVGGDWYGIIPLPGGRLVLTVGDIAGHGFSAATAMAQLYHALHGLALTGADSGPLLGWLNTLTCSLPTFTIASACCAIYDPARRRLSLANAGHPSPVLVRAGSAAALPKPGGTMLGVDPTGGYEEHVVELEPGDVLLLYTDGLIERRKHSPEEDIDNLLAISADPETDLEAFVDRILSQAQADTDDDTCVIAVRFG